MLHILYMVIIQPLVTLTEFFFVLFMEVTHNSGIAVLLLSAAVTLLTLPLYMVAESWQEKERQIEAALASKTQRIKEVFTGDERYMMTATLYRESHYHPIMALRSSFSLAIQVPFFIAAYNFLSWLPPLKGASFLFIRDMGLPDGIIKLGTVKLNLLPIVMTAINCIAGTVYSKGHSAKERVQIYLLAAVFLLLLYKSPSGLVLYWTMNNVLSLVKDIFYRLKNPRRALSILSLLAAAGLAAAAGRLTSTKMIFRLMLVLIALCIAAVVLLAYKARKCNKLALLLRGRADTSPKGTDMGQTRTLFVLSASLLALLAGAAIPSMLVESETVQFCYVDDVASPFVYIKEALCQAAGFFVLWPACFYALFGRLAKKVLAALFACMALGAMLNCFAFGLDYGPLDSTLLFMTPQKFTTAKITVINIATLAAVIAVVIALLKARPRWLSSCIASLLLAIGVIAVRNAAIIQRAYSKMSPPAVADKVDSVFHLSRTERNVIVLMQDKLHSPFVTEVLKAHPELPDRLDGFVRYINCVSPAHLTMLGTPGIFGGYDYTPYYMNKRGGTLRQKHNEAILSMPVLFHEAHFRTSVADMPYENYLDYPTERAYDGYPFIKRVTTRGVYSALWYKRNGMKQVPYSSTHIKRNMIWFSVFKMSPTAARQVVYHGDYWLSWDDTRKLSRFIDNYSEIDFLDELMDIDNGAGSFVLLDNEATHECVLLEPPDYVPQDNSEVTDVPSPDSFAPPSSAASPSTSSAACQIVSWENNKQYSSTVGILMRLADFFDWMKANGVYDNTRIIIVSDHGGGTNTGTFGKENYLGQDSTGKDYYKTDFVASLLVKDFGERGGIKTSMEFMTNADTPALATKGIIENAVNPFTHTPLALTKSEKEARVRLALAPAESTRIRGNTQFKVLDDEWYTVKDDIYKAPNWAKLMP